MGHIVRRTSQLEQPQLTNRTKFIYPEMSKLTSEEFERKDRGNSARPIEQTIVVTIQIEPGQWTKTEMILIEATKQSVIADGCMCSDRR